MKHQIWLEYWERKLVRSSLLHLENHCASEISSGMAPTRDFALRWTIRQLQAVGKKFEIPFLEEPHLKVTK